MAMGTPSRPPRWACGPTDARGQSRGRGPAGLPGMRSKSRRTPSRSVWLVHGRLGPWGEVADGPHPPLPASGEGAGGLPLSQGDVKVVLGDVHAAGAGIPGEADGFFRPLAMAMQGGKRRPGGTREPLVVDSGATSMWRTPFVGNHPDRCA